MAIKILVDAHIFDGMYQGTRTYIKGLYCALINHGFEIYLAAQDIENLKLEFKGYDFKFIQLNYKNPFLRLGYEFPRLIRKHKFDFAHFNYTIPLFLSKKCKYIVTIHDILFLDYPEYFNQTYRIKNKLLFKRSAKKGNIITTVSDYSKQRIHFHFKIPLDEILVTPNSITQQVKTYSKANSRSIISEKYGISKFLLFVSRIEPRKNHEALIQSFIDLKLFENGYSLVFIGKPVHFSQQLNHQLDLISKYKNSQFFELSDVTQDDLYQFYNAAEFTVFPSFCEGFGIPPLESLIYDTPVVCSNTTAMSEFNFEGIYFFHPTLKGDLNNKILHLLEADLVNIQNKIKSSKIELLNQYNWDFSANLLAQKLLKIEEQN